MYTKERTVAFCAISFISKRNKRRDNTEISTNREEFQRGNATLHTGWKHCSISVILFKLLSLNRVNELNSSKTLDVLAANCRSNNYGYESLVENILTYNNKCFDINSWTYQSFSHPRQSTKSLENFRKIHSHLKRNTNGKRSYLTLYPRFLLFLGERFSQRISSSARSRHDVCTDSRTTPSRTQTSTYTHTHTHTYPSHTRA